MDTITIRVGLWFKDGSKKVEDIQWGEIDTIPTISDLFGEEE